MGNKTETIKKTGAASKLNDVLKRPCPSQAGTFTGYEVQIKRDDGRDWRRAPLREVNKDLGVPLPAANRGVLHTLGLLGYEQAKSLAWFIKAIAAAECEKAEVRIVPYDIEYDAKAYGRDSDIEAL